jgi:hypothetical protein
MILAAAPSYPVDPDALLPENRQPTPAPAETPAPVPEDNRVTELMTAGYYELVADAKALGLAVTGGVPELRARIAEAEKLVLPPVKPAGSLTLTIDSAQQAGLVTVDAPGDGKLLRISGGLQVTLVDNEKKVTHIIDAAELWYDQANEEMTARGQVVYTMIRESSREVFRGESLTFRLSDSQGVFYSGASDRPRAVGDKTLNFRYQGDAIRRSSSDLVVLETGTITSSLGTDPYYRIQAKRIWVLAPGEWGLQDAVLYLGRIPVFYFPFFFQPGDEFFFNPVLSFPDAGDRRGTGLQTTTYIWGHKKRSESPMSFLQVEDTPDQGDKVLDGLFLVKGTPPPPTVPANWTLKYLADFYANLGFLTAVDGSLPGYKGLNTFTFQGGMGITRTVNADGTTYTENPFQPELDPWAQSQWNGSWLGSTYLPFRWGGQFVLDSGWGNLSINYYSDPLLYNDMFGDRSEDFSVFNLLGLGPAQTTEVATPVTSLQWSAAVTVPPATVTAGLLWGLGTTVPAGAPNDPQNTFYEPSQLTLPQVTLSFAGTLWPPTPQPSAVGKDGKNLASDLLAPDASPADTPAPAAQPTTIETDLAAPDRFDNLPAGGDPAHWMTGVNWSLKPTFSTDTRFDNASVTSPSQSTWSVLTSRWLGAYDATLSMNAGLSDGSLTNTNSFVLHQQTQDTWYKSSTVDSPSSTTNSAAYDQQDQAATSSLLSQSLISTWKPFVAEGGPWRESNAQYSLATKLWSATYFQQQYFDGTANTVTTNQASSQAIWYLIDGTPSLKAIAGAQTSLPPLSTLRVYTSELDYTLPTAKAWSKTTAQQTDTAVTWLPLETYGEWKPDPNVLVSEDYQYDLQNAQPLISTSVLTFWGFSIQYLQQQTIPYHFDTLNRVWAVSGPQAFLPQQLTFSYTLNIPGIQWWYYRNSLSSKVNFTWPINLQQYSEMPMTLNYTVIYKLARFVDLQVTEGVVNTTAYRYFPFITDSFGPGAVATVNPLTDLWDSVSVWDQAALQRTGFKMTQLTVSLVHYLDDWQVSVNYTGSPQLIGTTNPTYQWQGTLTLLVQWYPLPELKTQLQVDPYGNLTSPKTNTTPTTTTVPVISSP